MRRRRDRGLTPEERALWQRAIAGTAPRHPDRSSPPEPPAPVAEPPAVDRVRFRPPPVSVAREPPLAPDRPVGIDRRRFERLKQGRLPIEGVLDLHGRTQVEAHLALEHFLARAQLRGWRCVLIVTGKGQAGGGVLRHMLPRWLAEARHRQYVVAYTPARPGHGGEGAFYVLVKRRRSS